MQPHTPVNKQDKGGTLVMKRFLACIVMACFLALPGTSSAETGIYVAPKFLMTFQNTGSIDPSSDFIDPYTQFTLGGALAAGYDFHPLHNVPLRVEVELALRGNSRANWNRPEQSWTSGTTTHDVDAMDVDMVFNSTTLLANVYLDFHNSTAFTPYVGAGIGLAFNYLGYDAHNLTRGGRISFDKHQTNLAWQVGAGVAYHFTENIAVDLAYRYLNLGYMELTRDGGSVSLIPYNHEILLGLRVGF